MSRLNIKKLFSELCCSNCRHDFDEDSVYILREEEGFVVLQVVCSQCQKSFGIAILGIDSIGIKDVDEEKLALQVKEFPEPISDDDVIDAHNFIKNLEDDWAKYLPIQDKKD